MISSSDEKQVSAPARACVKDQGNSCRADRTSAGVVATACRCVREREIVPGLRELEDGHAVHVDDVKDAGLRASDGGVHLLGAQVDELSQQLADGPFVPLWLDRPAVSNLAEAPVDVDDRLLAERIQALAGHRVT